MAWFTIDPISTADGIILSNANQTMTSDNYENKVGNQMLVKKESLIKEWKCN